jgi:glycerol-3-phosphate dehydrogenase subunit C
MGRKYAQKLARGIEQAEAQTVITDCNLSARRIEKENGVVPLHPVDALARAYGIEVEIGKPGT